MTAERRRINRIENKFGIDLQCRIVVASKEYLCEVIDFNSLGIRIVLSDEVDARVIKAEGISLASIFYGSLQLGVIANPRMIPGSGENHSEIVLVVQNVPGSEIVKREIRAPVPYFLEPVLTGADPVRIKENLVFRIGNVSSTGFRAKTSFSNRHLLQGQSFRNFKMFLPTIGEIKIDFQITNVRPEDEYLSIGCRFENVDSKTQKLIQSFLILVHLSQMSGDESPGIEMKDGKVSKLLRVRRVDNVKDFQSVLDIRFKAYKGASKLVENATIEDMTDEFDQNSIVLGAFIGARMVGTIRIVFSSKGSGFPFEKYFPFPGEGGQYDREMCVEVSKLAIDPAFQGSDVLFRLFQSFALEFIPKRKYAFLMATDSLAKNYVSIGARRLSGDRPHPVVKTESLALYLLETSKLKTGNMSALTWLFFARELIDFLSHFGFTNRTKFPLLKYAIAPVQILNKFSKKIFRRRRRS